MIDRDPGNTKPYDKVWAILSVDDKGNEGILGVNGPIGPMNAITGSESVRDYLIALTRKAIPTTPGKRFVLAEFHRVATQELP